MCTGNLYKRRSKVWWILFLLLLTSSASTCLQHSRNLGTALQRFPVSGHCNLLRLIYGRLARSAYGKRTECSPLHFFYVDRELRHPLIFHDEWAKKKLLSAFPLSTAKNELVSHLDTWYSSFGIGYHVARGSVFFCEAHSWRADVILVRPRIVAQSETTLNGIVKICC